MKSLNFLKIQLICLILIANSQFSLAQNVGINENGATPDASAILDLSSTSKGFLAPRMTTAQRNAIPSPAHSLLIFNTTVNCFEWWDSIGGSWVNFCCSTTPPAFPCGGTATAIVDVFNPATGQTWMDRNLGASQAATSKSDALSYGDLYQWGRCSDGHEKRTSSTTTTLSSSDTPGNGNFILSPSGTGDWRSPKNDNLWQGVNGINNPCPTGYRIPTEAELNAERLSWSSNDDAGAFASPLKLPVAGNRSRSSGSIEATGLNGAYWTSSIAITYSRKLLFNSGFADFGSDERAFGLSVRCIKN